ncbi:MAG: RHS repeat-associated core domain-containing protein, partial [Alloacidobacterium sp.]
MTEACDDGIGPCAIIGHDEFNRLTSRTPVSGTQNTYSYVYDRYGNRWQENTNGAQLSYISANNHINLPCVHQISGICYDAAGNITWDGVHSYTYDAEGNILNVDNGSTAVYVYDALNRRVSTQTTSGTTEYIFDYAGRRISSWLASNNFGIEGRIYWDGMPIVFHSWNNYIFFQHQDWLGTERVRTDYAGAIADTDVSMPFGDFFGETFSEAYANQDNNHFAGLERDTESGTEHAQFRQYSELNGNWMSPDPYDGSYDFSNPQSFNRYSYVMNNPLSFTDPSGKDPCPPDDPCPAPPSSPPSSCDAVCQWVIGILFGQKAGAVTVGRTVNGGNTNVAPKTISVKPGGAPNKGCTTGFGAGLLISADAGAGLGLTGAGGNVGAGVGLFGGNGINAGAFASGGVGANFLNHGASAPSANLNGRNFAGAGGGAGGGIFLTNASQASQLSGPFATWNVDLGWLANGAAHFAG